MTGAVSSADGVTVRYDVHGAGPHGPGLTALVPAAVSRALGAAIAAFPSPPGAP